MLKIVQRSRDSRLDLAGGSWLASYQKLHTCQACQKLKRHASCCTTGQKSLAGQALSSCLELATQPSREVNSPDHPVWEKLTLRIPFSPHYIQILISTKYRELLERILKEKPQRKIRLIHPQSLHRDSSNSSTFFISIVTSLRGTLPKPFLIVPIFVGRPFGVQEAVKKEPISYWLMLWSSSRIR